VITMPLTLATALFLLIVVHHALEPHLSAARTLNALPAQVMLELARVQHHFAKLMEAVETNALKMMTVQMNQEAEPNVILASWAHFTVINLHAQLMPIAL